MTPAERARHIDRQEFAAECQAVRERAFAYAKQCRKLEKQMVKAWMQDDAQPIVQKFVFSGRPPATHTYNGVSRTVAQWASHLGISAHTLANRRRRLGSFEAAIAMGGPTTGGPKPTLLTFNGQSRPLQHWAAITGLKASTLTKRLGSGWNVADTLTTPLGGRPGVVANLRAIEGTGAGSTAQEIPEITFSEKAENA